MNLSVKLSLSVLAGLVALLGVLGYFGFSAVWQSTDRTIDERLVLAGILAHDIDEELSRGLLRLEDSAPQFASGLEIGEAEDLRPGLEQLHASTGQYSAGAFVLDERGRVVISIPGAEDSTGMLVSSYASARRSIDRRQPVISGSVQSASGEGDFISISVPVFAESGDALGAVGLALGPASSFLRSLLPPSGLGETAYAQVINESGTIIASTVPPEESGSFPVTAHEERFAKLIDNREAGVWTCHRCHEPSGEQGGREQDIMAFSPLTVAPWGIAIRQAKAEAFAPRNELQDRFLVSGSIALGLALAATLLIGQTLSRPLRRLTRASRRIAEGDLDYAISVPGKDEVGQLGRAFETMRRALKQSRQELGERSRALATLEERERIAREMHDSLSQTLNYIRLSAGLSKERLEKGDTSSLGEDLESVRQAARDAYEEVRQGIQALRSNGVLERGMLPALMDFVERFCSETKLNVRISLPPSVKPDLSDDAQVQALRIVQEALANIRKHAEASRVTVEFAERQGWVEIRITDDGCGFDPSSSEPNGQHFGLQIMRERAESVGGAVDIESRVGEGTCVTVRLPAARTTREE